MTDKSIERDLKAQDLSIGDRVEIGVKKSGAFADDAAYEWASTVKGTVVGFDSIDYTPIFHIDDDDYTKKLGCVVADNLSSDSIHSSYSHLSTNKETFHTPEAQTFRKIDADGNPIKRKLQWGLSIGDKIDIGFKKDGSIVRSSRAKWDSSLKATVVGFDGYYPIVHLDEAISEGDKREYEASELNAFSDEYDIDYEYQELDFEASRFIRLINKASFKPMDALSKQCKEKFGVDIGQKIWVYQQSNGSLVDKAQAHTENALEATVIGYDVNLTVCFEEENTKIGLHTCNEDNIHSSLKHKYNTRTNKYWWIYGKEAFTTENPNIEREAEDESKSEYQKKSKTKTVKSVNGNLKEEQSKKGMVQNMSNNTTKPEFWTEMKSNAVEATYRVGANQLSKGVKAGLISLMEKQGHGSDKIKALSEMLDSQIGQALISSILGYGLMYIPKLGEDERVEKLCKELRINGMTDVGNFVMDGLIEHLLPVVQQAISNIPSESHQLRVGNSNTEESTEEEQVQKAETPKTLTA